MKTPKMKQITPVESKKENVSFLEKTKRCMTLGSTPGAETSIGAASTGLATMTSMILFDNLVSFDTPVLQGPFCGPNIARVLGCLSTKNTNRLISAHIKGKLSKYAAAFVAGGAGDVAGAFIQTPAMNVVKGNGVCWNGYVSSLHSTFLIGATESVGATAFKSWIMEQRRDGASTRLTLPETAACGVFAGIAAGCTKQAFEIMNTPKEYRRLVLATTPQALARNAVNIAANYVAYEVGIRAYAAWRMKREEKAKKE